MLSLLRSILGIKTAEERAASNAAIDRRIDQRIQERKDKVEHARIRLMPYADKYFVCSSCGKYTHLSESFLSDIQKVSNQIMDSGTSGAWFRCYTEQCRKLDIYKPREDTPYIGSDAFTRAVHKQCSSCMELISDGAKKCKHCHAECA
jgi:hypothetical protein